MTVKLNFKAFKNKHFERIKKKRKKVLLVTNWFIYLHPELAETFFIIRLIP